MFVSMSKSKTIVMLLPWHADQEVHLPGTWYGQAKGLLG